MPKATEIFRTTHFQDTEAHVFNTRNEHPYLDADDIDFEMQFTRRSDRLLLRQLNQNGLERFVREYGKTYQILYLDNCTRIRDFSPLADLTGLEAVRINWCKCDSLWDMSQNKNLKVLCIAESKKLTWEPKLLQTAKTLVEVRFWGPVSGGTYSMASLECFRDMASLRRIDLNWVKLENKSMDVLDALPNLEEFHFEPGMLTTEEIAWIVARYPQLYGVSLGAYNSDYIDEGEIRICGNRKPTLYLPKQQKRLDEYIRKFDALVEDYRKNT